MLEQTVLINGTALTNQEKTLNNHVTRYSVILYEMQRKKVQRNKFKVSASQFTFIGSNVI